MDQTRYKEEMHVSATRVEVERSTSGLTTRQNEEEIIQSVGNSSNGSEENPCCEGKQECIPETSENPDSPQEINLQPVLGFTEPYDSQSGKTTRDTQTLMMSIFFTVRKPNRHDRLWSKPAKRYIFHNSPFLASI